ncbi:SPT2 chromatin protein-domain-containing protein [Lipomyces orientalis]|uniref:SPT2 chromatin protein-domain-containing protein n=1 Tax=Lipomyces orientalis TaxID=1233043 RepID=A0ACC3TNJ7_9ASCO
MFSQLLAAATSSSPSRVPSTENARSRTGPVKSAVTSQNVNFNNVTSVSKSQINSGNTVPRGTAGDAKGTPIVMKNDASMTSSAISKDRAKQRAMVERLQAQRAKSSSTSTGKAASSSAPVKSSDEMKRPGSARPEAGAAAASASILATNRKKPNFLDILKEAEKVDSEKLKFTVKVRDPKKKPEKMMSKVPGKRLSHSPSPSAGNPPTNSSATTAHGRALDSKAAKNMSNLDGNSRPSKSPSSKGASHNISGKKLSKDRQNATVRSCASKPAGPTSTNGKLPSRPVQKPHTPAPFAKPMEGLLKKNKAAEESDESLDDFIVSDDEEEGESYGVSRRAGQASGPGYDREEIWNLFRRGGRSRNYDYEDDDDNMEATGFDVLREEMKSTAHARKEDEMMDAEERRLAEMKKKRRKRA